MISSSRLPMISLILSPIGWLVLSSVVFPSLPSVPVPVFSGSFSLLPSVSLPVFTSSPLVSFSFVSLSLLFSSLLSGVSFVSLEENNFSKWKSQDDNELINHKSIILNINFLILVISITCYHNHYFLRLYQFLFQY